MKYIDTTIKDNYIIAQLNRGSSNPINEEMVEDLITLLNIVKEDDSKEGLILTGKPNFFSAGLDIVELYDYDKTQFEAFWNRFIKMMHEFVAFPKPFIAAITGHSPAGGCVMAIGCDYRVMAEGKYKIGLNEIPVGIIVPTSIYETYAHWVGTRNAYQYIMEGRLMDGKEALKIGLIDELVDPKEVLIRAEEKMKTYLSFEQNAWKKTKRNLRSSLIDVSSPKNMSGVEESLEQWWSPTVRGMLKSFVERLKK